LAADVGEIGHSPYHFVALSVPCVAATATSSAFCQATSPTTIPAGKRLVINHVTANIGGDPPGGTFYNVSVFTTTASVARSPVAFVSATPSGGNLNHAQQIFGFADAGSTVTVHIDSDAALGNFKANVAVAGTLVTCNMTSPCDPILP
jgi:hypothetical protein